MDLAITIPAVAHQIWLFRVNGIPGGPFHALADGRRRRIIEGLPGGGVAILLVVGVPQAPIGQPRIKVQFKVGGQSKPTQMISGNYFPSGYIVFTDTVSP